MKKALHFAAVVVAISGILAISQVGFARITGTEPGTDIWCVGPSGAEVCVDASGNLIPTTTNDASLGTSSLRYSNVYTTLLNVSGASTLTGVVTHTAQSVFSAGFLSVVKATQTLAVSGSVITADACGGLKRIYDGGAATTTDTTNTFTAATSAYAGCKMDVINVGSNNITLDYQSGSFITSNAANIVLTPYDSVSVMSDGSYWYQIGSVAN